MRTIVIGEPPAELAAWLERRQRLGLDLHDEVWEGEHHVAPAPSSRHARIDRQVAVWMESRATSAGLVSYGPLNLGIRSDYRVPDGVLLRSQTDATFVQSAVVVIEIVSPGDETFEKFGFYFDHGVEEVVVLDAPPGAVEWYVRGATSFERSDRSGVLGATSEELAAEIEWPS